jgi:hypothetical protein
MRVGSNKTGIVTDGDLQVLNLTTLESEGSRQTTASMLPNHTNLNVDSHPGNKLEVKATASKLMKGAMALNRPGPSIEISGRVHRFRGKPPDLAPRPPHI